MTALDNLARNYAKTAYTTAFDVDKIIGVREGIIQVPAPTAINSTVVLDTEVQTDFGDYYYVKGIFTFDGGVTWNDMNAQVVDVSNPAAPVFQVCDMYGIVGSQGTLVVRIQNYYNFVAGTGTARTVHYKIVMYARNGQGKIIPETIPNKFQFTTKDRWIQKIARKGEIPFNIVAYTDQSTTVTHNLGYVPKVEMFYYRYGSPGTLFPAWATYRLEARVTETDVTFLILGDQSFEDATGQIEYRIYYEQ